MENQTVINTTYGVFILALIAGFAYVGLTDEAGMPVKEPTHYCNSTEEKAYCFDVRDYGDKIDYRCLYDEANLKRYFSCPEGWKEIPFIPEEPIIPAVKEIEHYSGDEILCHPPPVYGCTEK